MSMETDILLRTILYQALVANSLEEVQRAIEVMCTKDLVAAVREKAEEQKRSANGCTLAEG